MSPTTDEILLVILRLKLTAFEARPPASNSQWNGPAILNGHFFAPSIHPGAPYGTSLKERLLITEEVESVKARQLLCRLHERREPLLAGRYSEDSERLHAEEFGL